MTEQVGAAPYTAGPVPGAPAHLGAGAYPDPVTAPPTVAAPTDQSVGDLVSEVARDLSTLVRQEIELAKVETKDELTKAGKAAGMLGGAGFAGYMVALFLTVAIMAALDLGMPLWAAALIVTAIWGVAGAVLYARGRQQMKKVQPPRNTIETVKEDASWARHPTS